MEHDKTARIKDLTLMLMYLTSWEENVVPGLRRKPDRTGMCLQSRCCWKGYDFAILNELTEAGLVNSDTRKGPAVFSEEGTAKALELLKQYGIEE